MRTTLTLEDDVAAELSALQRERGGSFKEAVNDALRAGVGVLRRRRPGKRATFRTEAVSLGQAHLPNLDDVSEVLAFAEGELRP